MIMIGIESKTSHKIVYIVNEFCSLWQVLKQHNTYKHYENTPKQHTTIFHARKNDNFHLKFFVYFLIFALNIDCNEYPQSIFWSKNKKIMYTPVNPSFTI